MPPKKDAKGGGNKKENIEVDEVLQAVVVADSFNHRYRPLTLDKPRCLLPLANIPLIEYTLEFLAASDVDEIYIIVCAHAEQISGYLKDTKWKRMARPRIHIIVAEQLRSLGDALREVDQQHIIKSDFILVNGDVVSNMNLEKALAEHRARKTVDKNAIMTMVLKQASVAHRTRAKGEEALFVLDSKTNECLHFESMEPYPQKNRVNLDVEMVFKKRSEVSIRSDLIDCQIDICALDVLALFTENFDYQDIRKHFVRGVLESDILGQTIYAHIVREEYAARARNTQMYESISKDVLGRFTYPMVPDSNILEDQTYSAIRPHIYKEENVVLSRSVVLEHRVVVGSGTEISGGTTVKDSIIGRNCKIGQNVVIEGSYIWDNVVIGDNVRIKRSIIAHDVVVRAGAEVQKGCILSYGVVIGTSVKLPEFTKLTRSTVEQNSRGADDEDDDSFADDDDDEVEEEDEEGDESKDGKRKATKTGDDDEADGDDEDDDDDADEDAEEKTLNEEKNDLDVVGVDGKGHVFIEVPDEDETEEIDPRNIELGYIGRDYTWEEQEEDDKSGEDSDSEGPGASSEDFDDEVDNRKEQIEEILETSFTDGTSIDDVFTELKTRRLGLNMSFHDLRSVLIPAVLKLAGTSRDGITKTLTRWGELIKRFSQTDVYQTVSGPLDIIRITVDFCVQHEPYRKQFVTILKAYYDLDVVEEDSIVKWHREASATSSGVVAQIVGSATPLIKWLEEAEEDEDDDDDEEEEEEEEE
ncbi:nucleotide-diphospho-sugar transferase [Cladochytrium replicatum]|nr:nucleotide-diphospho-sugar transferase [Cladochytrium replicatum]